MNKGYDLEKRVRRFDPKNGFTIAELIVVIVVIGILATVTIVGYGSWKNSTLAAAVKSDLNGVVSAMEDYRNFNDGYPSTIPTTFTPSSGVSLTVDASSTATDYCINGVSSSDVSIKFYVASSKKEQGAIQGTCADLTGNTIPSVPNNLLATSFAGSSVSLSWSAAVSGADSYTAQCAYDAAFINNSQQSTQSSTSTTLSGFTPSTVYCRVKATNSIGDSKWSGTISSNASLLNGLVAWYPFNGNAKDATGNGNNGVVNGASLTYGIDGNVNGAYSFNGLSNYIDAGNFGTLYNQGTISLWIKATVVENYRNAFTTDYNGVNNAVRFEEYTTPNPTYGGLSTIIGNASSYTGQSYMPSAVLSPNTWYHVVLVWNKGTNNVIGYLNNVLRFNASQTLWPTTMPSVSIGNGYNASRFWKGSIDDVRIYDRALSASEVSGLYDAYAPQSTLNGLAGWWPLIDNTKDASGNSNNLALFNGVSYSTANSGALSFDGVASYATVPANSSLDFGTGDFSVSFWSYRTALGYQGGSYLVKGAYGGPGIETYDSNFRVTTVNGSLASIGLSPNLNVWENHTLVVTQSGTPYIKHYINGALDQTGYVAGVATGSINSTGDLIIGRSNAGGVYRYYNGSISDFRLYNKALSQNEASQNFTDQRSRYGL